ncbi:MAG TPA: M20/M25/M40 family metallo-hydrolase [Bryobacteraceae bacterium]|nr:M20/M25/M40 family metallo-hydrolase [Bryobacteraceae bacterium]
MKSRFFKAPLFWAAAWLACAATPAIDPAVYLNDIKFLASQEMRGRASGSPELEKAADFIARHFREFGLQPVNGASYYQAFPITLGGKLGRSNGLHLRDGSVNVSLKLGDDYMPFQFSSAGKLNAAVVFAGYGITAPEYHYDDYAGMDVKGKLVLVLRHEPQEFDEHSVFAGREFTQHASFTNKAVNAKMHGAAGVILINDVDHHAADGDRLPGFSGAEGPSDAGIIFVQLKAARVAGWFAEAGKSVKQIEDGIDRDLKPESFAFPDSIRVDAAVDIAREVKTVHNVAGYLPGSSSESEYVVIGAHYDHLGLGGQYSLAPSQTGTVHPGADDNASGTAGVIELARWFSRQPKQKRGILFLCFAGEELGLLGSEYYVAHPDLPLDRAVAMINMDMIGRVRNAKLYIGGVATGSTLRATLDGITPKYGMKVDYSETSGYGSSDHTSFTAGGVPVLFFFSGLHADYHKPSDTWDKIDAPDAAKVLEMVAEVTDDLRGAAVRPQFVKVAPPAHGGAAGPVSSSSGGGYGPYFGSVPDFGEGTTGVKFADIREGSPAAKAGLKAADVLVEFDGKPIQNLYDFTYALQAKKPGDVVKVKVMRGTETVEAEVTLTKRQ